MDALAKLLGLWLGNPVRALVTLAISSAAVLWLARFQLFAHTMQDPFWRWPALVCVLSIAGLFTYVVERGYKNFSGWRAKQHQNEVLINHLCNLTTEERHELQPWLENDSRSATRRHGDRVIAGLVRHGVLTAPFMSDASTAIYEISAPAWEYLRRHPECIATPEKPRPPATGKEWMKH